MSETTIDTDSLVAKLLAGIRKAGSSDDFDEDDLDEGVSRGRVPVSRLRRSIAKNKELQARVTEMEGQLTEITTGYAGRIEALKTSTTEELGRITSGHHVDLQLVDQGVTDPLGRRTVKEAYGQLAKGDRPKSPAEWFTGLRTAHAAHLEDPEANEAPTVPRPLQPYLAAQEQVEAPTQTQQRRPPPAGPAKGKTGLEGLDASQGIDGLMAQLRGMD